MHHFWRLAHRVLCTRYACTPVTPSAPCGLSARRRTHMLQKDSKIGHSSHVVTLEVRPQLLDALSALRDCVAAARFPLPLAGALSMLTPTGDVRPLEEMENEIIRFAISHYRGQMSEVARRLKIGRSTLYRKLDEAAANAPADGAQDSR